MHIASDLKVINKSKAEGKLRIHSEQASRKSGSLSFRDIGNLFSFFSPFRSLSLNFVHFTVTKTPTLVATCLYISQYVSRSLPSPYSNNPNLHLRRYLTGSRRRSDTISLRRLCFEGAAEKRRSHTVQGVWASCFVQGEDKKVSSIALWIGGKWENRDFGPCGLRRVHMTGWCNLKHGDEGRGRRVGSSRTNR